jgi:GntR family transcriptional regulator of vanillate catabolism
LEQEGLIEPSTSGGYQMRSYTAKEVLDAIRARGVLEGFGHTLAEQGLSRALSKELKLCLSIGDEAVNKPEMDLDDYASYVNMNKDFHSLIMDGCENASVLRMMERLNAMPFASPSAMLPMQSTIEEGTRWMQLAHLQHHHLFQALERGQSVRAQGLGEEHVKLHAAILNMRWKNQIWQFNCYQPCVWSLGGGE